MVQLLLLLEPGLLHWCRVRCGHSVQLVCDVKPVADDHVPPGHAVQLVAPRVDENVPAGQMAQVAAEVAPTVVLKVPSGHRLHEVAPAIAYAPAGHCVHAPVAEQL